ncbi:MAG: hypothetical protein CO093_01225 [Alphaproteobacteria bacterium CG_4_9_14_3_um_filter_47_13]|nr:MAG: hypothetical protein CO093_01225 [Alphaproteobacteria bacterium CG_4_9_14_3_um_filter_47_13]
MSKNMKSICLMVRDDQYEKLHKMEVNMSGYIRDLIDDSLSDHIITLNVAEETKTLYDRVISMSSNGDAELEPHLRIALKNVLDVNIREMQKLQKKLEAK